MEFWIGVLVSSIASFLYRWLANLLFTDGILRIDRSDPEKDVYRIELNNLSSVHTKKRIILKIDSNADLSQK